MKSMKNKKSVIRYVREVDSYMSTGIVSLEALEDFEPERETTEDVFDYITRDARNDEKRLYGMEEDDDAETPG